MRFIAGTALSSYQVRHFPHWTTAQLEVRMQALSWLGGNTKFSKYQLLYLLLQNFRERLTPGD